MGDPDEKLEPQRAQRSQRSQARGHCARDPSPRWRERGASGWRSGVDMCARS